MLGDYGRFSGVDGDMSIRRISDDGEGTSEQRESTDADPGVADDGYTTGFEILGQLIEIPEDQIGLLRSGQELP